MIKSDITQWLTSIGMSQYGEVFSRNNVRLFQLPELTEADFEKIGIASFGDRKSIIAAVQNEQRRAYEVIY